MRTAALFCAVLLLGGCTLFGGPSDDPTVGRTDSVSPPPTIPRPEPVPQAETPAPPELDTTFPLVVQRRIDGDSFVGSDDVEYRVGMINTPEADECGGVEAAAATNALLAEGFRAETYTRDRFERAVSQILTPSGDLGVILAERGLADDRFLDAFAVENPPYAADLADAFERARSSQVGLWATCWIDGLPE